MRRHTISDRRRVNALTDEGASQAEADGGRQARLVATAYHESGHAVMAVLLGRLVHKVTIEPGKSPFGQMRLGQCEMGKGRSKASKDLLEEEVLILYAGMVAEAHFSGKYCESGARQDLANILRLLEPRVKTQKQLERLQKRLLGKTEYLLADDVHARAIKLIASELLEKTTISGRAVRHFFRQATEQQ